MQLLFKQHIWLPCAYTYTNRATALYIWHAFLEMWNRIRLCLYLHSILWHVQACLVGSWRSRLAKGFNGPREPRKILPLLCLMFKQLYQEIIWKKSEVRVWLLLTGGNWQKWKRVFLTCPCHEIYRDEAVGLKSCKNTWKITIFVKMRNLGQYPEILIFCQ